ncbi:sensor histidine kinase [Xylophilus sp. ASV27]|uniref:sensor histidine kinase n=1 Tax=Xylophilus sp. ASV27 TaxID=2795129 RepID=UPI0018EE42F1|nr:histidine kinase [Xylophilus sp. ASV27]
MRFDGLALLRHYLQVLAFCLAISALQYFFRPERPYEIPLVYSVSIGTATWALIEAGRLLIDPRSSTGWPRGWRGLALTAGAIVAGYVAGTSASDAWFGWSSWSGTNQREMRASWLISLVAGVVISYYFHSRGRGAELARRAAQAQREAAEARLKLLEVQLEPHMLFNTLANLRMLIATDPARAETMLDHLVAYLRATLGGSRVAWHALADEFARLDDYLALMAVRMGERLHYTLALPAALREVPVPPLLLQPLVENSIRHGLEPQLEGGRIEVSASTEHDGAQTWVRIEVRDSGVGLAPGALDSAAPGHGFGTRQVRERLLSAYGAGSTMELIAQSPGGTRSTLRFPLKNPPTLPA